VILVVQGGGLRNGRATQSELLEQKSVFVECAGDTCEQCAFGWPRDFTAVRLQSNFGLRAGSMHSASSGKEQVTGGGVI
jgi:hypothetical protein